MEKFNFFQAMLDNCKVIRNNRQEPLLYLCALEGQLEPSEEEPKKFIRADDNTDAYVIVYNVATRSLSRKRVKHNTKGYFINFQSYWSTRVYLTQFK